MVLDEILAWLSSSHPQIVIRWWAATYCLMAVFGIGMLLLHPRSRETYYRRLVTGIVIVATAGAMLYGLSALRMMRAPTYLLLEQHLWLYWILGGLLVVGYTLHLSLWFASVRTAWLASALFSMVFCLAFYELLQFYEP